jgi:predicted O-methyltransferase YrrM
MSVPSQLSRGDFAVLTAVTTFMSLQQSYQYLELGSYLGASLQWHLRNQLCNKVVSVDKRSHNPILDERNIDYTYTSTTQDMLDALHRNNVPTDTLTCIDGTIDDLITDDKFDLIFIDAEHTNSAAYYDACKCLLFLNDNGLIMFHDDWIVFEGIENFEEHLKQKQLKFAKFKLADSDITVIAFGDYCNKFSDYWTTPMVDWDSFKPVAQQRLSKYK